VDVVVVVDVVEQEQLQEQLQEQEQATQEDVPSSPIIKLNSFFAVSASLRSCNFRLSKSFIRTDGIKTVKIRVQI
jgi:hypothetical protein